MGLPLLAALGGGQGIAAIGGFLGSLFGKKKKPEATGVDYVKLRNDATAAGFNPLTALLAGGGSGYQREFAPSLASGAFLQEAIGRGIDTVFNRGGGDKLADMVRGRDAAMEQVLAKKAQSLPGRFGYALTDAVPFGVSQNASVPALPLSADVSVRVNGLDVKKNAGWSGAQDFEDRYGDALSSVYGVGVLGADLKETFRGRNEAWLRQYGGTGVRPLPYNGAVGYKKPRLARVIPRGAHEIPYQGVYSGRGSVVPSGPPTGNYRYIRHGGPLANFR